VRFAATPTCWPLQLQQLVEHFEIPEVADLASLKPELDHENKRWLLEITQRARQLKGKETLEETCLV